MRFRDLLDVPFDGSTGRIDTVELKARLPHIPDQIVDEWLAPHGRNSDMQRQYAEMDLEAVDWSLTRREAHEILEASVFPGFRKYLNDVAKRASDVSSGKWNAADSRPQVVSKWRAERTWLQAPIFVTGELAGSAKALHLVEGHTRCGLLYGLVGEGVIEPNSMHSIWIGASSNRRAWQEADGSSGT